MSKVYTRRRSRQKRLASSLIKGTTWPRRTVAWNLLVHATQDLAGHDRVFVCRQWSSSRRRILGRPRCRCGRPLSNVRFTSYCRPSSVPAYWAAKGRLETLPAGEWQWSALTRVTQAAATNNRNLIESGHPYTDSCTRNGGLPATTRDLTPCVFFSITPCRPRAGPSPRVWSATQHWNS